MSLLRSIAVVAVLLALVGCTRSPEQEAEDRLELIGLLEAIPGVGEVVERETSVTVIVTADATDDEVLSAAAEIPVIIGDREWPSSVDLNRENLEPIDEEADTDGPT